MIVEAGAGRSRIFSASVAVGWKCDRAVCMPTMRWSDSPRDGYSMLFLAPEKADAITE